MQRLGGARRYSREKRAVENRKAEKGKVFAFKIFMDRVRERLPFLRGNPKGAFLPMWRMKGGIVFYHPVVSYGLIEPYRLTCGAKHWDFLRKSRNFRKRNVSLIRYSYFFETYRFYFFLLKIFINI